MNTEELDIHNLLHIFKNVVSDHSIIFTVLLFTTETLDLTL